MKIYTITLHHILNSGSALQAYALQKFLIKNGYETEIINYRPIYFQSKTDFFKTILRNTIYFKSYISQKRKFSMFQSQFMKLTKEKFTSYNKLENSSLKGDIYITGSDQIWNSSYPCGKDKAYYLSFVNNSKKMSYAASLGKEPVPSDEIDWIISNVGDFEWVSVREFSSKKYFEKKGIRKVDNVCDPVFLLDNKDYEEVQIKPQYNNYVVVYLVQKSELLDELLNQIKKKYGYKIILIGVTSKCNADVILREVGPREFVGLIANAEFVIASSFHAVSFSLIFDKEFATILPKKNSARIENILEIAGKSNRIVRSKSDIKNIIEKDNKKIVSNNLDNFIEFSRNTLLNEIKRRS